MKKLHCCLGLTFCLAAASPLCAQATSSGAATAASVPAPAASNSTDQAIVLTPYDVSADKDNSYGAVNSNGVTRFNMELSKLPVSADIFTSTFMNDIAATSVEGLVVGNSAGAGLSSIAADSVTAQPGDHVAHEYIQLRGFDITAMQRDSLMPVGPLFNPGSTAAGQTSVFDVERVEVIDGPSSLLYSSGGPGGAINVVSKQAYFGQQPTGSLLYRFDQYGSKYSTLDFGQGNDSVAVRVALLDQDQDSRRVNVGQKVNGEYVQIAVKPIKNTTVRVDVEQTVEHGELGDPGVVLSSVTGDGRAGLALSYLLATNQTGATINGSTGVPNTAGALLNGELNWNNVDSLSGWLSAEYTKTTMETIAIDSTWGRHLSTEIAFGYSSSDYAFRTGGTTLYAPTNTANPTGTWAMGLSPSETDEPALNKAIRASVVDTQAFGDVAQTETILGADFVGSRAHSIAYSYWEADSNWNPVHSSAITTNDGRTKLPTVYYPLSGNPTEYPLFPLGATQFTYNGTNYIRMPSNEVNPTLISPSNPLGLSGSGLNEYNIVDDKGIFLTNTTEWGSDQRLTTLAGARLNDSFDSLEYTTPVYRVAAIRTLDYDVGANYALLPWLSPYASVSDAVTPPQVMFPDPAGNLPKPGRGVGEEIGVKFNLNKIGLSGSLSFYHSEATNEEFDLPTSVTSTINPTGLNGSYAGSSNYVDLDRNSRGVQLVMTAAPTPNWRLRLAAAVQDGRISNNLSYTPLYNDQFYENSAGDVTYADGSIVYVNSAKFTSSAPTVAAGSANAVPLTVGLMNTPTSLYYANPADPSGAITSSSDVATVLKSVSSTHGSILTGATGLPISDMQITPSFGAPGAVTVFRSGMRTLGTPLYSLDLTGVYTVPHGIFKGLFAGTSMNVSADTVGYYYPVNGFTSATPTFAPFMIPTQILVNPILGYEFKLGHHCVLRTQLNITNLFNHYDTIVNPSLVTGYTVAANLTASIYNQPRVWEWSNSISF